MCAVRIADVTPATLAQLNEALASLSADLGDRHRVTVERLDEALFGACPACHGVVAIGAGGTVHGAALYSPAMSTTFGVTGAYVSDLWVRETMRGQRLGQKLLAHVARRARARWHAGYIRLVTYADNPRATAFYERLGFRGLDRQKALSLDGKQFAELIRMPDESLL